MGWKCSEVGQFAAALAASFNNFYAELRIKKHTFGARLRAEGVSYEDRQDLLGHRSTRITTHYSSADVGKLLAAANKVCCRTENTPLLTIIRRKNASEGDYRLVA